MFCGEYSTMYDFAVAVKGGHPPKSCCRPPRSWLQSLSHQAPFQWENMQQPNLDLHCSHYLYFGLNIQQVVLELFTFLLSILPILFGCEIREEWTWKKGPCLILVGKLGKFGQIKKVGRLEVEPYLESSSGKLGFVWQIRNFGGKLGK